MSCHALMKSAFLVALLLVISEVSANDQLRLLRGVSDPTSVGVEQGSTQYLGQNEPHHDNSSADAPIRQLGVTDHRGIHGRTHSTPHTNHKRKIGTHPSQGGSMSSRARPRQVPGSRTHVKKQMMKDGGQSSRRHGAPRSHGKMKGNRASTRGLYDDDYYDSYADDYYDWYDYNSYDGPADDDYYDAYDDDSFDVYDNDYYSYNNFDD